MYRLNINKPYLIAAAVILAVLFCTPGIGRAEVGTANVNGISVDYVTTPPQRGAGLTHEEVLDLVRKSKPALPVLPIKPSGDVSTK